MPIYEFRCPACGSIREELLPISDSECAPDCINGCGKTVKEFSAPSVHASRTSHELKTMMNKRSADHYRKTIAPHRKAIEEKIIGKLSE
jgi:putative FmdB family regulatory protein